MRGASCPETNLQRRIGIEFLGGFCDLACITGPVAAGAIDGL
jgi:hypothetical protein